MKTYLSPTGVNLVDEFGNYVGKLTPTSTNIQRDGYFFTNMEKEDEELYLYERETNYDKWN
jgi:hypothetical protein|tara:strand:- start:407 stop:589 length:183 start_codon:yes stop_codon:yes gene_type:complete